MSAVTSLNAISTVRARSHTTAGVRARVAVVAMLGAAAAIATAVVDHDARLAVALAIAASVLAGELLVLRLDDATALPLAYAAVVVATRVLDAPSAIATIGIAEALAIVVRVRPDDRRRGVRASLLHFAVGAAAVGAATAAGDAFRGREHLTTVLVALGAGTAACVLADELGRRALRLGRAFDGRGLRAWLALASCGILMALGAHGVAGRGRFGVWGSLLFGIPLLAAWWSFERLHAITRAQRQTLEALAMAPELAGFVADGHSRRVRTLAREIALELGLPSDDVADLEAAALLHHLGAVTLDHERDERVRSIDVARTTAALLRPIPTLERAGAIVAGDGAPPRWDTAGSASRATSAQVLAVASAFDDVAAGDPARTAPALDRVMTDPGSVVDLRVIEALERVVGRRADAADSGRDERAR